VTTAGADSTPAVVNAAAALGNIVIADHGRTVAESLGSPGVRRFRPALQEHPLTQSGTVLVRHPGHPRVRLRFDPTAPARAAVDTEPGSTRPELWLTSTLDADSTEWTAVADLLDSGAEDPHVVAETEADGSCQLRFGAHGHGRPPRTAEVFSATYRYGNGVAGNIGADALGHVITAEGRITGVRNPLPASGGTEPEAIAQVRRRAPEAFRTQQRAVTPGDYERVATRSERVQRAAATMRWTGSWHTVFLTVDPIGDTVVDAGFEQDILDHVEPFRLAGHDVEIDAPHYVSLEVALEVCVTSEHFRSDVRRRLQVTLSATDNDDGTRGLFHPDAFTFSQPVYLSPILAAARAVAGVDSVRATVFQRLGSPSPIPLAQGRLPLGRLEIARLDNDPNFPEHGTLRIVLHGGK
jgi:predicted phage baseplate assembly protein